MAKDYNGWRNRKTWNIALWINNDETLYREARDFMLDWIKFDEEHRSKHPYRDFTISCLHYMGETPDGVNFNDPRLDLEQLDDMMKDLVDEEGATNGQ